LAIEVTVEMMLQFVNLVWEIFGVLDMLEFQLGKVDCFEVVDIVKQLSPSVDEVVIGVVLLADASTVVEIL
jgi:hypothetical protein